MSSKLQEGKLLLSRAGNDQAALGMALGKLHASLEEYLRDDLCAHADVPLQVKDTIADVQVVGWLDLANLAQQYGLLKPKDRKMVLEANGLRLQAAHGEAVGLNRAFVERYASFVEEYIGTEPVWDQPAEPDPDAWAPDTAPPAWQQTPPQIDTAPPDWQQTPPQIDAAPPDWQQTPPQIDTAPPASEPARRRRAIFAVAAIVIVGLLLGAGLLLSGNLQGSADREALLAMTSAAETATGATTATAPSEQGRSGVVIGVGEAGLRVRATPSLSGELVPIKLAEGTRVRLVGGPEDADGHTWWQIQFEDAVGWCSGAYLQIE